MLLYGPDGSLWPAGTLVRTLTTDSDIAFETGTLPDWLELGTTGDDTGSSSAATTEPQRGIAITTAASSMATATIYGPEHTLSDLRRIRIDVIFTGGSHSTRGIQIGFQGAASGGWMYQNTGRSNPVGFAVRAAGPTDTTRPMPYEIGATEATIPEYQFVTSIILDPPDKMLAVGEHDQIWTHYVYGAEMAVGTARPFVRIRSNDGAAKTLHVHQIRLTREWL